MSRGPGLIRLLRPHLQGAQLLQTSHVTNCSAALAAAAEPARYDPEPDNELPSNLLFEPTPRAEFVPLDFNDPRAAFEIKSSLRLLRNWAILSTCQFKPLVNNAEGLLKLSQKVLGSTITNGAIKHTFFQHFCAGETQQEVKETMQVLAKSGIGGILDYAAEEDVEDDEGASSRSVADKSSNVVARTYDYATEAHCDSTKDIFLHSIQTAADMPGQGFAALKVTGLGNPHLLERVSNTLNQMRTLFKSFDSDRDGFVSREGFVKRYREEFTDGSDERLAELYDQLDTDHTGKVDFLSWSDKVSIQNIPRLVSHCRESGPLSESALSEEELQLFDAMMGRLFECAEAAAQSEPGGNLSKKNVERALCTMLELSKVSLMVDAEHSFFQPAIDHAARELCRKYNREKPVIFNTYQCYLTNSYKRAKWDMERARRQGWKFGAKLVRGAYLDLEAARAKEKGYDSPIWGDIEHTHANYNRVMDAVIHEASTHGAEVMIASHNQASIEHAVALMHELDLDPSTCGVYFGQLLGMSDTLTYVLGGNGYRAYKYVPFGPVAEVMPYLVRRAQENSAVLGIVPQEKAMIMAELRRRIFKA